MKKMILRLILKHMDAVQYYRFCELAHKPLDYYVKYFD